MSSIEIHIIVEGKTEQFFVRDVLAPYMAGQDIYLRAIRIGKPGHKGGDVRFQRALNDIKELLAQRPDTYVSTMFDYFRIDSHWPGKNKLDQKINSGIKLSAREKATILEQATLMELKIQLAGYEIEKRFIPYIEMHEFEGLLFSDAEVLADKIKVDVQVIDAILVDYNDPEEINTSPSKAPSKRLEKMWLGYNKVTMGKAIAEAIGIDKIRQECANFDCWLRKMEKK